MLYGAAVVVMAFDE
jgi:5-methyltetrahydrofolate--homocysteine methyltransferase